LYGVWRNCFLPLKIDTENRVVAYWLKLCEDMNNLSPKLSAIVYKNILNVSMTMTENDVLNTCNKLGNKFHYLFECTIYDRERIFKTLLLKQSQYF